MLTKNPIGLQHTTKHQYLLTNKEPNRVAAYNRTSIPIDKYPQAPILWAEPAADWYIRPFKNLQL